MTKGFITSKYTLIKDIYKLKSKMYLEINIEKKVIKQKKYKYLKCFQKEKMTINKYEKTFYNVCSSISLKKKFSNYNIIWI